VKVHFATFTAAYAVVAVNVFAVTPWGPGVVAAFTSTQTILFMVDGTGSELMSSAFLAGAFVGLIIPTPTAVFAVASTLYGVYLAALGIAWTR
jgi:hypothetical protein